MSYTQNIKHNINSETQKLVNDKGRYVSPPIYHYNTQITCELSVFDNDLNAVTLNNSNTASYIFGFDSTYTTLHADLYETSDFVVSDNKLTFLINTNGSSITTFVNNSIQKNIYCNLWLKDDSEEINVLIGAWKGILKNVTGIPS